MSALAPSSAFKFEFPPIAMDGGDGGYGGDGARDDSAGCNGVAGEDSSSPVVVSAADDRTSTTTAILARMMDRCIANANACRIVDASSSSSSSSSFPVRVLAIDPRVDSHMEGLRYVVVDDRARPPVARAVDDDDDDDDDADQRPPRDDDDGAATDLIPGVYEGGLKVWECSLDLCRYLASIIVEDGYAMDENHDDEMDASSSSSSSSSSSWSSWSSLSSIRSAITRAIGPCGSTLELGCGHGLPGCLILREGALRSSSSVDDDDIPIVVFSDFNDFVIRRATIPNACLNVDRGPSRMRLPIAKDPSTGTTFDHDEDDGRDVAPSHISSKPDYDVARRRPATLVRERSIFVSGDWMGLSYMLSSDAISLPPTSVAMPSPSLGGMFDDNDDDELRRRKRIRLRQRRVGGRMTVSDRFDLILASETTYTTESCLDTAFLMLRHLRVEVGIGLVATKRFYFGVGGGTDAFISACEALSSSGDYDDYNDNESPLAGLRLRVEVVRSYDTGNANIRDLLMVICRRK
ncbi:hypothetical protein ACHAXA_002625 [Cyclostephanos tholiformis]|uniref:protein-histidine N-methyltransferase n=1 Tax=Cyclostephanos tholiformis TaxID=382380 RepID=A0ABD3SD51_9STRA